MSVEVALVILYFVPSIVAVLCNPKKANSVFVLNLFLGWTFVFWVVAFAIAVSD